MYACTAAIWCQLNERISIQSRSREQCIGMLTSSLGRLKRMHTPSNILIAASYQQRSGWDLVQTSCRGVAALSIAVSHGSTEHQSLMWLVHFMQTKFIPDSAGRALHERTGSNTHLQVYVCSDKQQQRCVCSLECECCACMPATCMERVVSALHTP